MEYTQCAAEYSPADYATSVVHGVVALANEAAYVEAQNASWLFDFEALALLQPISLNKALIFRECVRSFGNATSSAVGLAQLEESSIMVRRELRCDLETLNGSRSIALLQ